MPKKRRSGLLGPLKSPPGSNTSLEGAGARAKLLLQQSRELAERARRASRLAPFPSADEVTSDHPYSQVFGLDGARRLLDPELEPRRLLAAKRRAKVRELSLGGRRIKEIAEAVGLNPDYVVKIRARLRREGKLPPL